ncbi:MAG TPA: YeeE/YedE family protein [Methylophilaceae bacterium]|jgi:hypothetical protein
MSSKHSAILAPLFSLLSGLLFGVGLIYAGMSNPAKVLAFLDIAGNWDPSLAFVMAGALAVSVAAFYLAKKRRETFLNTPIDLPSTSVIDRRLVIGSIIFGVGWGIAGICPGPALVLVGAGNDKGFVFFIAMLIGFAMFELISKRKGD